MKHTVSLHSGEYRYGGRSSQSELQRNSVQIQVAIAGIPKEGWKCLRTRLLGLKSLNWHQITYSAQLNSSESLSYPDVESSSSTTGASHCSNIQLKICGPTP